MSNQDVYEDEVDDDDLEEEDSGLNNPTMKDIEKARWAEVEYWETKLAAFTYAIQGLDRYGNDHLQKAYSAVHEALYNRILDAYRNLFMIGLFLNPEQRDEIKKMAYDRFLEEGNSIMWLVNPRGENPSSYWEKVEKRIRHLIRSRL